MTKLYFHAALSGLANLPTAKQSATVSDKDADAQTVNRTMNVDKGVAQTSIVLASLSDVASNDYYFTKFVSDPLKGITSISANTWNFSVACAETNVSANFPVSGANLSNPAVAYVWRPSSQTKVGNIVDAVNACSSTFSEPASANTEVSEFGTFAGASVASVQDGDVIVFEVWFRTTQASTTGRNDTFYFDGSVETNNTGTTVSSHAAYIETPQTLTFIAIKRLNENVVITDAAKCAIIPAAGSNANILTKKMTLTLDATSGVHDQAFTGVGFQPKAMIVFGVLTTGTAYAEGSSGFYGFSDGASHNACVAVADVDAVTTYDCSNLVRNDACICLLSAAAGNAETIRGVVKTFDSNGVTITWNVKNTTQYIIHALFIGGTDLTNVFVGQSTSGQTSTGARGYTGVGFKPDITLFAIGGNVTVNTLATHGVLGIGAAVSNVKQFATLVKTVDAVTAVTAQSSGIYFGAAQCLVAGKATSSSTFDVRASFTSNDTDGFTITHNTAPVASTFPFIYMCIKGGYWDVGTLTQKTSTGIQTITPIVYADPEALLLTVCDDTAKDQINLTNASGNQVTISIGACDNTAEGYIALGHTFQTSPNNPVMISSTAKLLRQMTPNATATSTALKSEVDISDMATVGDLDINWTTADAVARQIGYVLLQKGPVATGSNITRAVPTQTITVSETAARLVANNRAPATQTIVIGETAARLSTKNRALATQTVAITDTNLVRIKGLPRGPATQTIAVAEASLTRRTAKNRAPATQTITVSEALTRLATKIRALAVQTITVSESLTKQSTKKRAPATESITVSEGLARRATKSKALPIQTIVVSESLTRIKGVLRALPTQTVTVSDALIRLVAKARAPATQSITVSDSITRLLTKIRALPAQTIVISDAIARTVVHAGGNNIVRAVPTQTITVSDAIIRRVDKIRALAVQTIVVSDVLNRLSTKARALPTQAITVSEVIARTVFHPGNNITRTVPTQTVTVSDSITRQTVKIRVVPTQIITVTDSIIKITGKARALPTQTVTVSDAITRTVLHGLNLVRTLTQNIIVGEALARRTTKNRALPTQSVIITDFVVKSLGRTRALAIQTVTIGESLTRKAAKIRVITQLVSIIEHEIQVFKNGLLIVPIQRPDKGGWFWKPPRIKMIRYPVYILPERIKLERRKKLREFPPLVIIPAFKYSINEVVAPFIITDPISQTVSVRFAISSQHKTARIRYAGLSIPISLVPRQSPQKRLNTAKCASFIANPEAISRYSKKLNKFAKVLRLWSIAQQVFTSHD